MLASLRKHLPVVIAVVLASTLTAGAPGFARTLAAVINADKLDGRNGVGCGAEPASRSNVYVATCSSGPRAKKLPLWAIGTVSDSKKLAGRTAADFDDAKTLAGRTAADFDDAQTLEGKSSAAFAAAGHEHSGAEITSGSVAEARIDPAVARDAEIMPAVLGSDGTGSGLDADLIDGQNASAFAPRGQSDLQAWCALAAANPASYSSTPCTHTVYLDFGSMSADVGRATAIATGTDGNPVIAYSASNTSNPLDFDLRFIHCATPTCSAVDPVKVLDSAGSVGTLPSVAIGSDGGPIVSYRDEGNGDLKVAYCFYPSCSISQARTIESDGDVGWYSSIAIGTDGKPMIAYFDNSTGDLKIVHCTDVGCSSTDPVQTLDDSSSAGHYGSLAIGSDGNPIVSYYDYIPNYDLKVVHCTNPTCTAHDAPLVLDSAGDVGEYTSLAIGTDRNPVISYYDVTNADLKVIHCTNPTCATRDVPRTLVSAGDVGQYSSIAIGTNGNPVISYWGTSSDVGLQVVRCATPSCSGIGAPRTVQAHGGAGSAGRGSSLTLDIEGNALLSYCSPSLFSTAVSCSLVFGRVP